MTCVIIVPYGAGMYVEVCGGGSDVGEWAGMEERCRGRLQFYALAKRHSLILNILLNLKVKYFFFINAKHITELYESLKVKADQFSFYLLYYFTAQSDLLLMSVPLHRQSNKKCVSQCNMVACGSATGLGMCPYTRPVETTALSNICLTYYISHKLVQWFSQYR